MNKSILITIVVIAVLAIALLVFVKPSLNLNNIGIPGLNSFQDFSGVDVNDFVVYRDPSGFEIAYPNSMRAEIPEAGAESAVKVQFVGIAPGVGEIMQIVLTSDSIDALRNSILSDLDAQQKQTLSEGNAFSARIIQFETPSDAGDVIVRYALFSCSGQTAVFTALIPVSLRDDLKAVNYMTSTFKCNT